MRGKESLRGRESLVLTEERQEVHEGCGGSQTEGCPCEKVERREREYQVERARDRGTREYLEGCGDAADRGERDGEERSCVKLLRIASKTVKPGRVERRPGCREAVPSKLRALYYLWLQQASLLLEKEGGVCWNGLLIWCM